MYIAQIIGEAREGRVIGAQLIKFRIALKWVMPAASPDQWQLLRLEWERTPEMTMTEVANRLDVSVAAVSKRSRRELWTKADSPENVYSARAVAEAAVARLVKIVQTSPDDIAATKAAAILLDRTLGRVAAEQKEPLLRSPQDEAALEFPEWAKRPPPGSYQHPQGGQILTSEPSTSD